MKDQERFKLLFGPYNPPKTRRGKFLFCERRGTVKVGDYSDGPIPWPVKWGTRNSLILCGDLARAVRVEAAIAIAHHWGVRPGTVSTFRNALEVGRVYARTSRLYLGNFRERLLPENNHLAKAFARKSKVRIKIFQKLLNHPCRESRRRAPFAHQTSQFPEAQTQALPDHSRAAFSPRRSDGLDTARR